MIPDESQEWKWLENGESEWEQVSKWPVNYNPLINDTLPFSGQVINS